LRNSISLSVLTGLAGLVGGLVWWGEIETNNNTGLVAALGGGVMVVGTGPGHWYVGDSDWIGIGARVVAGAMLYHSAIKGYQWNRYDCSINDSLVACEAGDAALQRSTHRWFEAGAAVLLASYIYDFATEPSLARRHRAEAQTTLTFTTTSLDRGTTRVQVPGLAVVGTF